MATKTSSADLVSVVMAVHNGAHHLAEAISGLLDQTHTNFELIIVDDGSTDATFEIASEFDDERIRIYQRTHSGLPKSLNFGIERANGTYIARHDADDISSKSRLASQIASLNAGEGYDICASSYQVLDESGAFIANVEVPATDHEFRSTLQRKNPIIHGSVMLRSSVFSHLDAYNENLLFAQDYELWLRLSDSGAKYTSAPGHHYQYRISPDSAARAWFKRGRSGSDIKNSSRTNSDVLTPENYAAANYSPRKVSGIFEYTIGSLKLNDNQRTAAINYLARSITKYPTNLQAWVKVLITILPGSLRKIAIRLIRTLLNRSTPG